MIWMLIAAFLGQLPLGSIPIGGSSSPSVSASDDFTTNGGMNDTNYPQWIINQGGFVAASGIVRGYTDDTGGGNGNNLAHYNPATTAFGSNQCSAATVHPPESSSYNGGVAVWVAATGETGYVVTGNLTATKLYRLSSGTYSQLGSTAAALTEGHVLKLCISSSTLTAYDNDVAMTGIISVTDLSPLSPGQPGIYSYWNSISTTVSAWRGTTP